MRLDSVIFYTNDIRMIVDYYTQKIGLALEYQQGDAYASFMLGGGIRLGIKKAKEPREVPGHQTLFFAVSDARREYERAKANDLQILKGLTDEVWGTEFSVLDPDGNKLQYLQRKS